jgi:hypothetical protein
MLADFKASGVAKHRGSKGTVREAKFLQNFLTKYLPRTVIAAHGGEIISTDGNVSGQCDILVMDPSTPPFWDEDDYRIVPAECVYGVIEVKSSLDSCELEKAWKQIASVKALPKTAFQIPKDGPKRTRNVYGTDWPYVPTVGMIFGYDGVEIETLCDKFEELAESSRAEECPDSIWVLNKGFITWMDHETYKVEGSRRAVAAYRGISALPQQVLLMLVMHFHHHFGTAWMPDFDIMGYIPNELPLGTIKRERWDLP